MTGWAFCIACTGERENRRSAATDRFSKHLAVESGLVRQTMEMTQFSAVSHPSVFKGAGLIREYRHQFLNSGNVSTQRNLGGGPKGTRTNYRMLFLSPGNTPRKACTLTI